MNPASYLRLFEAVPERENGITFGIRMHGRSKLSLRVIWQYLRMLYELRRSRQA